MAAPRKLGAKWIHRVQVDGKRVSGTFDTKAAALAWEAEQRVSTPKGKAGLTKTCADAFEKYELEVSKTKRGYRWEALRLTFHDTRHEAITRLAKKLHVLDLARMVGHSDIRQLHTYYNETAADIAARI